MEAQFSDLVPGMSVVGVAYEVAPWIGQEAYEVLVAVLISVPMAHRSHRLEVDWVRK